MCSPFDRLRGQSEIEIESITEDDAHVPQENVCILDVFVDWTAAIFWASAPALSDERSPLRRCKAGYLPIQSISYELGSKAMSGYFVPQGSVCLVTLKISEKNGSDRPSPTTAARVRLDA